MISRPQTPSLLVVDDRPMNIELLGETLMPDYDVRAVTNGREAIEIARSSKPPDLILLDIMMPEMDGYDVCHRLKSDPRTRHIPIIFITARDGEDDEAKGLALGAVDYITKPFCASVVKARVKAHLLLKNRRDQLEHLVQERTAAIHRTNDALKAEVAERRAAQVELEKANQRLQELVIKLRHTQEHLIQSEKMAALGGLVAGVSHEISTPVGIAVTAASFFDLKVRSYFEKYEQGALTDTDLEKFMRIAREAAEIIDTNLKRAGDLITSFKQVGADQAHEEERRFNFCQYLQTVFFSLRPKLKKGNHRITVDCPEDLLVTSYPGVYSQIFTNLVINSVIHGYEDRTEGEIRIVVDTPPGKLVIIYSDDGKGIPAKDVPRVFDPFFTTKRANGGTGLGMHIVYNLVTDTLGGQIRCDNDGRRGARFVIEVPLTR